MEIKSPIPIPYEDCSAMGMVTGKFDYVEPIHNISMTKQISTLDIGRFGEANITLDGTHTTDRLQQYAGMQALMKVCVDNAEAIKDRLQEIVLKTVHYKLEEKQIEIMKMDFMALKHWFMDDVRKSKIYKQFKVYHSTKKLKPFNQGFNTFVLDRNKYTHGQLCFLRPNFTFVLEYVETPSHRKQFAHVDTAIFVSYNQYFKEVLNVITEYNIIHQTRLLNSISSTDH